jgi:hypothetical protein
VPFEFPDLHDATLVGIDFAWQSGECTVTIGGHSAQWALTFFAVARLCLPRKQRWGPSQSINGMIETSKGRFEIAMQSGDVLRIHAASVSVASLQHD